MSENRIPRCYGNYTVLQEAAGRLNNSDGGGTDRLGPIFVDNTVCSSSQHVCNANLGLNDSKLTHRVE